MNDLESALGTFNERMVGQIAEAERSVTRMQGILIGVLISGPFWALVYLCLKWMRVL